METATDFVFSLLRFLGLLNARPPRKNFKRNRIYDDFSSDDDEKQVMGYKQFKKFRWSTTIHHSNETCHNESSHIRNVREKIMGSYTTSTSKESNKKSVPHEHRRLTSNESSSTPVIDVEVDGEQEEPQVTWVQSKSSKNTETEPAIIHVDLEDINKIQQDDDVVFVEEVATPPNRQFESLLKKNHAAGLKDKVLSNILEDTDRRLYSNLHATSIKIKPTSKRKPVGKQAKVAASSRLPQKTQINLVDKINLDTELNADVYHNATKQHDSIRVPLRDSSESDVEEVLPESTTTLTIKKVSNKDLAERNRPQKLRSYNECQELEIKSNNKQNEARSDSPEPIKEWLAKIDAKYFPKPVKTVEKLNDEHEELSIVSEINSKQNETRTYKPDTAGDRVLKLEPKNNSGLLKSKEKLKDATQESNILSIVNTEQNKTHSANLNNIQEWLASLKSKNVLTVRKFREDLSNVGQKSNIVAKHNSEQDCVYSSNLNTSNIGGLRGVSENETDLQKAVKQPVKVRQESVIVKVNSNEIEARSGLLCTSLLKYNSTIQKHQENFNDERLKLNTALKDNSEQNEVCSLEPDSTEDWLSERNSNVKKTQEKQNEKPAPLPKVICEQNEACSYKPDKAEQKPSNLDCKNKTKWPKTEEKPQEAKSKQNSGLSFNTSEDLMLKLGNLYENYQQETKEKNKARHYIELVTNETQNNELNNANSIIVEIQDNVDLPALTPDQEKMLDAALKPEPEEEILVEKFNIKIHRRDLQTLVDLNWLNDGVINFYMNLLIERSEKRKDLPKVYATNTFFYPKLMQSGQPGLRRWTRKVDIFAYDLFMMPLNVDSHWCLCIVDFRARIIKYLNSGSWQKYQKCLDALLQYLKDEHRDKKGSRFDATGWETKYLRNIPRQTNGSDCGMFACTFAEFSSRDAEYTFTQAHMPYLRRKAALEILIGKLLI